MLAIQKQVTMTHGLPWLIEALQKVVFHNRASLPTSEFIETPERFGFVILYEPELGDALRKRLIAIPANIKRQWKLTTDQKYLCQKTGLELAAIYLLDLSSYKAYWCCW